MKKLIFLLIGVAFMLMGCGLKEDETHFSGEPVNEVGSYTLAIEGDGGNGRLSDNKLVWTYPGDDGRLHGEIIFEQTFGLFESACGKYVVGLDEGWLYVAPDYALTEEGLDYDKIVVVGEAIDPESFRFGNDSCAFRVRFAPGIAAAIRLENRGIGDILLDPKLGKDNFEKLLEELPKEEI